MIEKGKRKVNKSREADWRKVWQEQRKKQMMEGEDVEMKRCRDENADDGGKV